MTFTRERTGSRTFDLGTDGVAHYGLMADLLADTQRAPDGRKAMALLFDSAEAYLRDVGAGGAPPLSPRRRTVSQSHD